MRRDRQRWWESHWKSPRTLTTWRPAWASEAVGPGGAENALGQSLGLAYTALSRARGDRSGDAMQYAVGPFHARLVTGGLVRVALATAEDGLLVELDLMKPKKRRAPCVVVPATRCPRPAWILRPRHCPQQPHSTCDPRSRWAKCNLDGEQRLAQFGREHCSQKAACAPHASAWAQALPRRRASSSSEAPRVDCTTESHCGDFECY